MTNRRQRLAVWVLMLVAVLGHAARATALDFLWKVSGKTGTVYLVGSIHLLTRDFYPLSPTLDQVYAKSDLLVEEADLAELLSPKVQMLMLSRSMLPANQTLDKVVSPKTFALVTGRAAAVGLPIEPLKRFKPWALALTLASLEWQKAGFDSELGLDRHFYDRARQDGKKIQGLETAEYQISRFDGMPADQQEKMLAETLSELDTEMSNIAKLTGAWKAGDASAVERVVLEDLKRDPQMYERLLVERNRNWMPKLESFLAQTGSALVVVGAAHLVGPDGLLTMLKARGYQIEQM